MPIARLKPEATTLLVIDVQERLMPTIQNAERTVHNCAVLARAAPLLGVPVIVTEQYVQGLGHTAPALRASLASDAVIVEKTRFSALVPNVRDTLRSLKRPTVLVCGIEAHVCVLQSVLDLCANGWFVFYAVDAISGSQADQLQPAFRRMDRAGALPTCVLGAMYELMGDAQHPQFKACLPLAKSVMQ